MADAQKPTDPPIDATDSLESLESDSDPVRSGSHQTGSPAAPPEAATPRPPKRRFRQLRQRFNIYLLFFGLVVIVAGAIIVIAYLQNRQTGQNNHIQTQSLSQSVLQQLANSDATVGSNQTVLNVQSSAVFAGQVLVRQGLQVAGNLQIGGTVALNNITVSGTGQFSQASVSQNLSVTGNTAIQGAATIGKSLQVGGGGNFGGTLTAPQVATSSLQLNGDLVLTHHITTSGGTPERSNGSALGGGGTVSVSGDDTAGSISVNTGGSPAAGCFVTVTFTSAFSSTPHVLVTPIGSAAGGLSYYVNRSATSFSICDATTPPASSSFGFDYFVLD
jgi:cytoskeletal protein CcmA (bactofilin family)